jgi:MFS family permease
MNSFRGLGFGLSAELWIVQAGIFLNTLGYGAVLPFEIIYLHDGRGFSLGVAGLVIGTVNGLAVIGAPVAGPLIDRFGARATAAVAGLALAAGYGGLAFAHTPRQAFIAAAAAGAGNGGLNPSQSALLASLAKPELRHRATAVSRVAANIGFGLGGALGGLIAAHGLNGFVVLFLANAVTYVLYIAILVLAVRADPRPAPRAGGYRLVIRDRPFIQLALTNIAMIAVGWGVDTWIMPPYARNEIGVSTRLIGLLFLANALTVALAQIPVARLAEGRRRAVAMATAALAFVAACLLLLTANFVGFNFAYGALVAAAIAAALGECFYTTALYPLVADLAPPALRGRYLATIGMSWWLGLALAPTVGTQLLGVSPSATMLTAAGVALAAGLSALALERKLPSAIRLTPRAAGPRPRRARRRRKPPAAGDREP